jgi:hypothetical protein
MAQLVRMRATWSGTVVGPSISTFYALTADKDALVTAVKALFNGVASKLPAGTAVTVPNTGDSMQEFTGEIDGVWVSTVAGATIAGAGTANYVNGVGARLKWGTGGVVHGHHVTGSTFIVPISADVFEGAGNITPSGISSFQAAATAFAAAGVARIWSRPTTVGGSDGLSSPIASGSAPDFVSWLRSRRT